MPRLSKIDQLPEEFRKELDREIAARGFADYKGIASWLNERGYQISPQAAQRHGQNFKERMQALKVATEQAKAVIAASPDDEAAMNDALTRLMQERLFRVLLETEPDEPNLARLARAVADLSRSTISQRKWADEVRERLERQKVAAAGKLDELAHSGGLSAEASKTIRDILLGIDPLKTGTAAQ